MRVIDELKIKADIYREIAEVTNNQEIKRLSNEADQNYSQALLLYEVVE